MMNEKLSVILLLVCVVLVLFEMLWLYVVSQHQEEYLNKKHEEIKTAKELLDAVLGSPSAGAREQEINRLLGFADRSNEQLLCMVAAFTDYDKNRDALPEAQQRLLDAALARFDPVPKLLAAMKRENNYTRAYICRCLGDLHATAAIGEIRECLKSRNRTLRYNAGMALSVLGDEAGVITFLFQCETMRGYSSQISYELIGKYTGDKVALVRRFFETGPAENRPAREKELYDQIRVTLVYAVRNDRLEELKDLYIEGFLGQLPRLRLACVKAMSALGTPDLKKYLIAATWENDWLLRLAAIPGLEKIGDEDALERLARITTDEQWWVRRRAAEALARTDVSMLYFEQIIREHNQYALDAVKDVIYQL